MTAIQNMVGCGLFLLILYRPAFARAQRILQEHGDGHGSNPTGDGSDVAALRRTRRVVHVTDQFVRSTSLFDRYNIYRIDPNINHNRALFDPVRLHQFGASNGHDDNVGLGDNVRRVCCFAVTNGDRGIASQQQPRHGQSHELRSPQDDAMFAAKFHTAPVEQYQTPQRRARDAEGRLHDVIIVAIATTTMIQLQRRDIGRMQAVDIFAGIDRSQNHVLLQMRGQGQLNQNPVNGGIVVERLHALEEFRLCDGFVKVVPRAVNARREAGLFLHGDIGLRVAATAHENDRQAGDGA